MLYKMGYMFPRQLEQAKKNNTPFILPLGTVEYHGPHCAFGCDTLIVEGLMERLGKQKDLVLLPSFWYGAASYAVAGPDKGTIHVDPDALEKTLKEILKSLIKGGVKNIYILIHHQFEQENYMPTTLSAAKASKMVLMEFMEETHKEGWWGNNNFADYYENLSENDNPLNYIKVLPCMSAKVQSETGYDHAGKYESSMLKALYPETVNLEDVSLSDEWFIQSATEACVELGEIMIQKSLEDLFHKII